MVSSTPPLGPRFTSHVEETAPTGAVNKEALTDYPINTLMLKFEADMDNPEARIADAYALIDKLKPFGDQVVGQIFHASWPATVKASELVLELTESLHNPQGESLKLLAYGWKDCELSLHV